MPEKIRKFVSNHYLLSFALPFLIMLFYFAYRKMAPFGNSSILTVDLGQQYIDMFSGMRETILHQPQQIFYSFGKNFGGEMFSEWAYYLFSPLNLLLLFFNQANLPVGILFLTVLRFGLAGLSMQFLLVRQKFAEKRVALLFSCAYALSGWMVANQVNLLWQDQIILLPLIVYWAIELLNKGRYLPFTLIFAFAIIDNFYIAYMIGIFLLLFPLWQLSRGQADIRFKFRRWLLFMSSLLMSVLAAAIVLIPTAFQLLQGKGQDILTQINWGLITKPYLLPFKLIPGSFNFDEMKTGQANIFIPFMAVIAFAAYFSLQREKRSAKIAGFLITALYLISFVWQPLNILFHMMQFPVWYPYRYSFIAIFFVLLLGSIAFERQQRAHLSSFIISLAATVFIAGLAFRIYKQADYLTLNQIYLFIFLALSGLFVYLIKRFVEKDFWAYLALLVSLTSLALNAYMSTNNFSYLTDTEYRRTVTAIRQSTSLLPKQSFYRVGQTFSRTRGDAFAGGYNGGMHFASTVDKQTPALFGAFGQVAGDYYASYSYGTIITDAIFNMRYFIAPVYGGSNENGSPRRMANSYRPDLTSYRLLRSQDQVMTVQNQNALPIAFASPASVLKSQIFNQSPMQTTASLWQGLTGSNNFMRANVPFDFRTDNLTKVSDLVGQTVEKTDKSKDGAVYLTFTPQDDDAYYLTLPTTFANDNVWITVNGETIPQYSDRRDVVALNVANHDKNFSVTIGIHLRQPRLFISNLILYALNNQQVANAAKQIQGRAMQGLKFNQTHLSGWIEADKQHPILMTSIPSAAGWKIRVDGQLVRTHRIDEYFLGASIQPGRHRIEIYFQEPYFKIAALISLVTLIAILFVPLFFTHRKRFVID
ncbi:MAG: YfhO family protein [Oenococcus sp.]|uniref:YfhO family protein n=1 Tax=Oenococcus sp. TaxID=1979414 RepID=UPI0039E83C67